MQPSLRVARIDVSGYRLLTAAFAGLDALHRELQAVIRRHLPGVTASVLTLPVPGADGKTVDWYSDLSGQPQALMTLPAARRTAVKARLDDRLASLRRLADELPGRVRGSEPLADALRCATQYPDDSHVYVIGDEPVLTLWGFVLVKDGRGRDAIATAGGARRRRIWPWGLLVIALTVAAGGAWYGLDQRQTRSLEIELDGALAARCTRTDLLDVLKARLDQLDPERGRYREIRQRLDAERAQCVKAAALAAEVAQALWDCERLGMIRGAMSESDLGRQPQAGIAAGLDERIALCAAGSDYLTRLEGALGDCAGVSALGAGLGQPAADARPLVQARVRIDAELALCAAADTIGASLDAAVGRCEPLRKLDEQLGAYDVSRAPLAPIRARLDEELALCAKAVTYRQALVDAQMDCVGLRALEQRMGGEDASREPLQSIRGQLDAALGQCKVLEKLEESLGK